MVNTKQPKGMIEMFIHTMVSVSLIIDRGILLGSDVITSAYRCMQRFFLSLNIPKDDPSGKETVLSKTFMKLNSEKFMLKNTSLRHPCFLLQFRRGTRMEIHL